MSEINEEIKKVFLAGVGMVTEACDCTKEKLDELARKGNDILNKQSEKTKKWFDDMVKKGSDVMGVKDVENEPLHRTSGAEDLSSKLKDLTPEELARLKEEIEKMASKDNAEA